MAEENHGQGQYYLGTMCHKRLGVPQDNLQAHIWATIATTNSKGINRKRAAELRGKLLRKLTSKQKKRRKGCYRNGIRPTAEQKIPENRLLPINPNPP